MTAREIWQVGGVRFDPRSGEEVPRPRRSRAVARNAEFGRWYPIETAPKRGDILVWWPKMKLDEDDGSMTDEQIGGDRLVTRWAAGKWDEPTYFEANGGHFGDDWEYAEAPTMWSPLPSEPQ